MQKIKLTQLTFIFGWVIALFIGYIPRALAADTWVTVGTGTASSCNNAALTAALATPGDLIITFNCGSSPVTVVITTITIDKNITIDGGDLITLSGNDNTRIFNVTAFGKLALQNITLSNGGGVAGGGAIYNNGATVVLVNTTVSNNTACTATDTNAGCGLLNEGMGATTTIINSLFSGNSAADGYGGGIALNQGAVEVIRSTIESNTAKRGGGVSVRNGATFTARYTTFRSNQTTSSGSDVYRGGAIFVNEPQSVLIEYSTFKFNKAARGAAIYFEALAGSSQALTLQNSTINNNTGQGTGGNFGPAGLEVNNGVATIQNSTFSTNNGLNPSAIFIQPDGTTVTIVHSTIMGNNSSINVGGIQKQTGNSTLTLKNTLLASNAAVNCNSNLTLTNGGGNHLYPTGANGDCGSITGSATNPNVGSLSDNGGSTQTLALLGGGAVGKGSGCLTTDQRGYIRTSCDSGAYGFNATKPTTATVTSVITSTPTAGNPVYQLTVSGSNFTSESVVMWNGQAVPTVYNSASQLTAYVSIAAMNSAGIVAISVNHYNESSNSIDLVVDATKINPTKVTLTGPTRGNIETNYIFTATVNPSNVALPLDYTWEGSDLTSEVHSVTSLTDTVMLSWATAGVKNVTVTVKNSFGTVMAAQTLDIYVSPSQLLINGSVTGEIYQEEGFLATVLPDATELPLTYTWQATDQTPLTHTNSLQRDDNVNYTWTVAGTKTITVTAANVHGAIMTTHTIVVDAPPIFVHISGPTAGEVNKPYSFTTTISPNNVLKPVTYTWQTAENGGVVASTGLSHTVTFTWPTGGVKLITVTALSASGMNSDTYEVTISEPIAGVTLAGTTLGQVGQSYHFTATVSPNTTAQPISYTWQATGQNTVKQSNGLTDTLALTWNTVGEQVVTVTAIAAGRSVTAVQTITLQMPPVSLAIASETKGNVNMAYGFTATVSPITTTTPLTYVWQATDLAPMTQLAGITQAINLTWPTAGVKLITVTAQNQWGQVTATYTMTVVVPLTSVVINGSEMGVVNDSYLFTATVQPDLATQPISYTWQATDQPTLTSLSQSIPFTWTSTGVKVITVTAENVAGQLMNLYTITISKPITSSKPPLSVTLLGEPQGNIGTVYTFTAIVTPTETSLPLTYIWQATDQSPITHTTARSHLVRQMTGLSQTMAFNWDTPGQKWVTVTVVNVAGQVQSSMAVTVNVPISTVQITGPLTGEINLDYVFAATVSPDNVTRPFTYTWSPLPALGQGTAMVSYTWAITGTQTITVVASNVAGSVTATHVITLSHEVKEELPHIYLPIVVRK